MAAGVDGLEAGFAAAEVAGVGVAAAFVSLNMRIRVTRFRLSFEVLLLIDSRFPRLEVEVGGLLAGASEVRNFQTPGF